MIFNPGTGGGGNGSLKEIAKGSQSVNNAYGTAVEFPEPAKAVLFTICNNIIGSGSVYEGTGNTSFLIRNSDGTISTMMAVLTNGGKKFAINRTVSWSGTVYYFALG